MSLAQAVSDPEPGQLQNFLRIHSLRRWSVDLRLQVVSCLFQHKRSEWFRTIAQPEIKPVQTVLPRYFREIGTNQTQCFLSRLFASVWRFGEEGN